MRIENYIDLNGILGVSGLFFVEGSFGVVDGNVSYEKIEENGKITFIYCDESIRLHAEFSCEKNGVVIRRDRLYNLSQQEIEVNSLLSRFKLVGNAYEVYTQYNGWLHESEGAWQRLVTQITTASQGIRTCDGATPMMGFHDLYTGKNIVFHLIPNAQWQMTAKKFARNDREQVVLECGFVDRGLCLSVAVGECIDLPTVVFFTAENKTDLDAYKLHEWFGKAYPRRNLPIIYNSWLYCFDQLDVDSLLRQVDCAAEMGFEGFMIDAGWFGNGVDWWNEVGNWQENTVSGPRGRLRELSDRVRNSGMVFGLWFEPERVTPNSRSLAEHPDYYIENKLLDFSNPKAVDYMLDILSEQIDKYEIGWVKFDFNATIPTDLSHNAFYRYMQGQARFIQDLRRRYPKLYITNCASGGYRMELGQAMLFDDFWLSDNQGPYEGIRIVKDTLKRMPTALIQRWNVQKYCEDFPVYPNKKTGRMIHCNDGTWDFLIGIDDSFSEAFMQGGPMGFSCDLVGFPEVYKERWKSVIARYKMEREFYMKAVARILVDADDITAIEYSNENLELCVIQIFTRVTHAMEFVLYPIVSVDAKYCYEDSILSGTDILNNGIFVTALEKNACKTIRLKKI